MGVLGKMLRWIGFAGEKREVPDLSEDDIKLFGALERSSQFNEEAAHSAAKTISSLQLDQSRSR